MPTEPAEILEAIRALPRAERLRLVERVIHELAESSAEPAADPRAIVGMMADEPEVMDRAYELAMQARKTARMRTVDG
jgi:hypothetical protein